MDNDIVGDKEDGMIILFSILVVVYVCNALGDAIDHGKGSGTLYDLWHICKLLFFHVPIVTIVMLWFRCDMWDGVLWSVGVLVVYGVLWEVLYSVFKGLGVWKWDDSIRIPILPFLFRYDRRKS